MPSFANPNPPSVTQSDFFTPPGFSQTPGRLIHNPYASYGFPQSSFGSIDPSRTTFATKNHQIDLSPPAATVYQYFNCTINKDPTEDKIKKGNSNSQSREFEGLLPDDVYMSLPMPTSVLANKKKKGERVHMLDDDSNKNDERDVIDVDAVDTSIFDSIPDSAILSMDDSTPEKRVVKNPYKRYNNTKNTYK